MSITVSGADSSDKINEAIVDFQDYVFRMLLLKHIFMIRIKVLIHLGELKIEQATDTISNLELLANNGIILRKGDILSFSTVDIEANRDDEFIKELRKIDNVVFFSAAQTPYLHYDTVVSYYLVHK